MSEAVLDELDHDHRSDLRNVLVNLSRRKWGMRMGMAIGRILGDGSVEETH